MNRKKINIKSFFSFFLVVFLIFSCVPVYAEDNNSSASGTITKEIVFLTEDATESKNDEFTETITENGKKYKLAGVKYEITDQNPLTIEQEVKKEIMSDPIPEGEEYQPQETIEEDGIIYILEGVEKQDESSVQKVTGYTDYSKSVTKNTVPKTKNVTVKNDFTGETDTVSCSLVNVEKLSDSTWEDTYIDIVFESYNSNIFRWNGVTVSKDTSTPLAGYEKQLLQSVGADTSNYRILKTYWNGDTYTDSNGVICRNARADVQRKVNYYRANYAGEIKSGTIYKATYKGTDWITSEDQYSYVIKATATYELVNNTSLYILYGSCMLLLIVLIVLILYVLSNKKRKAKQDVQYVDIEKEK